ncbi:MAG: protein translocase subunit SecF [bacterium]|nr:protein translocase subunit SecF [bacterium]
MVDIIGKKRFFFLFSALVIIPGLVSLLLFGLRLSIDFTGGTLMEFRIKSAKSVSREEIGKIFSGEGAEVASIQQSGENTYLLKMKPIGQEQKEKIESALREKTGEVEELRFETVGSVISRELTQKAIWALGLALLAIVIYVAWAFRQVPKPASSWRFGVCAVAALVHDVLVVVGIFSLLGHFYHVEIDTLFITAILTVIGFSVHDTIVVFDRIRENLRKMPNDSFKEVVNESILQTLTRSINTSLTVVFVLLALLLMGGGSLRWFVTALLAGVISGTYSSIFNASPLLVVWQEWSQKRSSKS